MKKNIVVTGATSGIGLAIVKELIKKGENVAAIAITQELCDSTFQELNSPDNVKYIPIDLSSNREIVRGSEMIKQHFSDGKIDALVNCAAVVPQLYRTTEQGYEMQFQVNHLAAMHLTMQLLEYLKNAHGVVITTSSRVHRRTKLDFDDLMNRKRYFLLNVYRKSKLANVLFAYEFNRRYKQDEMIAYNVDPGLVNTKIGEHNTTGFFNVFWKIRRRLGKEPIEIVPTYFKLIYQDHNHTDPYYYKYEQPLEPSTYAKDSEIGKRFWDISETYITK